METKMVNVSNSFYEERFVALCEELEKGVACHIYVDCIGHTRSAWVEDDYVRRLKARYGDRLCTEGSLWDKVYFLK